MSVGKKLGIVLLTLVMLGCVVIDSWYAYVTFFAPDKLVDNTYEVGLQVLEDETTDYFIKIKYHSNKNKNGLECLDIQFNYLLDESQTAFFSQGLQYVANTKEDKINWQYYVDESFSKVEIGYVADSWYKQDRYYGFFGSYRLTESTSKVFNYASPDGYNTTTLSTNPINNDSLFKIQLGTDLFNMKFKGADTQMQDNNFIYKEYGGYSFYLLWGVDNYNYYYTYYDSYYFSKLIYDAMTTLKPGTQHAFVFEFGDLFNYYQYDPQKGSYSDTAMKNADSVIQGMKSYYSIYVEVSDDGVKNASDSLFNMLQGNANYTTGEVITNDYFVGRTIVNCDISCFNLVQVIDNYYALKLKQEFIDFYLPTKDISVLSVAIDLDLLRAQGIEFYGFTKDSGLNQFGVFECFTTETKNGQSIKTEVKI